jgi:hypothetical protein
MAFLSAAGDDRRMLVYRDKWLRIVAASALCWQECNENVFAFCYRMGWTVIASFREHAGNELFKAH